MEDLDDTEYVALEHDRLVSAISKLDKTQHITEPTRNEATNLNTEFNLVKRSKKLDLNNIVKVLEDTAHHVQISKKLKKTSSNVLPKPLEKPQAERVKRATGYEETKVKVGRWDPVVARSRTVDYVSFPLKTDSTKLQSSDQFISKFKLKSPLEIELEEVDPKPVNEASDDENEQLYPMSYEEMVEHRKNSAKLRAQQSYKAAKAKRQGKIKSKKYHRILKKQKLKEELKEFEELQKKDPEEALKKLEALDKARALERHTLRHKNTGKWAKSKLIRAKYDKEVRQELAEQLSVGRGLSHKVGNIESSDDEDGDNVIIPDVTLDQDPMNPWMLKRSDKSNVDEEFNFGYKKYLKEKLIQRKDESDDESVADEHTNKDTSNMELSVLKESINNLKTISDSESKNAIDTHIVQHKKKETTQKPISNKNKSSRIVATTNWHVEPITLDLTQEENKESKQEVENAFEDFENSVEGKIANKLNTLRNEIKQLEKAPKENKSKRKNNKEEQDNLEYLMFKNKKLKPVIDEELMETDSKTDAPNIEESNSAKILNAPIIQDTLKADIDPSRFIQVKPKYLNSVVPEGEIDMDNLDDDEQIVPKVNIEEVFEEDDVVASFRQDKEEEIDNDTPKDIDLRLPGWGSWGGKGVKAPRRRRNRFILKGAVKMPRRDDNKGDVVIKEYRDPKLNSHKISDVPFPFESVKEFEATIRAPIGNTFVPEKAHKKLIKPSVITKAGVIIEPMDEDELLVRRNRTFKNEAVLKMLAKK